MSDLTAFVLAGGKSSRMGRDKAFLVLGKESLLDRALRLVGGLTNDVRIVGDKNKFAKYAHNVIEDVYPNCGPLGGIHAALRGTPSDLNLILAVDMPVMRPEFLACLTAQARNTSAVVTVPHVGGRFQPLCAVYRREFADVAEAALRKGKNKIDVLFEQTSVQVIGEEQLIAAGFSPEMFRNVNTPEDLELARSFHERESGSGHEL